MPSLASQGADACLGLFQVDVAWGECLNKRFWLRNCLRCVQEGWKSQGLFQLLEEFAMDRQVSKE